MEHRYETRKPIQLIVTVSQFGTEHGRFPTRDVSYSGLYIDCPDIIVSKNSIIELVVTHRSRHFAMRAIVIHRSERGIGVMRLDYNEAYAQFLMNELGLSGPRVAEEFPQVALQGA